MTTIFVQFADSTESAIVSVFANAQDPTTFPDQASIPSTDARYVTFYENLQQDVKSYFVAPGA